MSKLTKAQVQHIAKLARLTLSDEEVERFTTELSSIIDYIDMLQEVDTKDIEPTEQVTGQTSVFREDEIRSDGPDPKDLLTCSPLPIIENQIQTPSAHG